MSMIKTLSRAGLALAMMASLAAPAAIAQHHSSFAPSTESGIAQQVKFKTKHGFKRSGFHRGGSFKGGSFHRGHGFKGSRFHGRRSFHRKGFKRGFHGSKLSGFGHGFHHPYAVGSHYSFGSKTVFLGNYASYGLYAPPKGYKWVYDKGGSDALLASIKTGKIIARAPGLFN